MNPQPGQLYEYTVHGMLQRRRITIERVAADSVHWLADDGERGATLRATWDKKARNYRLIAEQ
jgi:hypothetical protein